MQNSAIKEFALVNKMLINSLLSYCEVYFAYFIAHICPSVSPPLARPGRVLAGDEGTIPKAFLRCVQPVFTSFNLKPRAIVHSRNQVGLA